jgi:hypothetical protein
MQCLGDAENADQDKGVYGGSADCGLAYVLQRLGIWKQCWCSTKPAF